MVVEVEFPTPLRDWIADNLQRGCEAQQLIAHLQASAMAPTVANAMVNAVLTALANKQPLPCGPLRIPDGLDYRADRCLLPAGSLIDAGDRQIPVLARLERPHVAVLESVLDVHECRALIELARPRLRPSTLVDPMTGRNTVSDKRSSEGCFLRLMETPLVERIDRRIAHLTGLPVEHGEGLQILRYKQGALSAPHFDHLLESNAANRASIARSGQRVSTLVIYLNKVEAGGATFFPAVGFTVQPRQGNAVYFEYTNPQGLSDPLSLHAGSEVLAGEKWVATKWTREKEFIPGG